MDYKEFREKLGILDIPNAEQRALLIEGNSSVHFQIMITDALHGEFSRFIEMRDVIEQRGGIKGHDYIITGHALQSPSDPLSYDRIEVTLHTTDSFMSKEDLIGIPHIDLRNKNE